MINKIIVCFVACYLSPLFGMDHPRPYSKEPQNKVYKSPLHLACIDGNFEEISALIEVTKNINRVDLDRKTALQYLIGWYVDKKIEELTSDSQFNNTWEENFNDIVVRFIELGAVLNSNDLLCLGENNLKTIQLKIKNLFPEQKTDALRESYNALCQALKKSGDDSAEMEELSASYESLKTSIQEHVYFNELGKLTENNGNIEIHPSFVLLIDNLIDVINRMINIDNNFRSEMYKDEQLQIILKNIIFDAQKKYYFYLENNRMPKEQAFVLSYHSLYEIFNSEMFFDKDNSLRMEIVVELSHFYLEQGIFPLWMNYFNHSVNILDRNILIHKLNEKIIELKKAISFCEYAYISDTLIVNLKGENNLSLVSNILFIMSALRKFDLNVGDIINEDKDLNENIKHIIDNEFRRYVKSENLTDNLIRFEMTFKPVFELFKAGIACNVLTLFREQILCKLLSFAHNEGLLENWGSYLLDNIDVIESSRSFYSIYNFILKDLSLLRRLIAINKNVLRKKFVYADVSTSSHGEFTFHRDDSLLHSAIENNKQEIIDFLLSEDTDINTDINSVNIEGNTPLHIAVKKNNEIAIKMLLEKGADPNFKNPKTYQTPLMLIENVEIGKILCANNAQIAPQNSVGIHSIFYACKNRDLPLLEFWKNKYGGQNFNNKLGVRPPLNEECFKLKLIKNPSNQETDIETLKKELEFFNFLIECGCNVNTKDKANKTCLDVAIERHQFHVVEFLLANGAQINNCVKKGSLAIACRTNNKIGPVDQNIIKLLIAAGAHTAEHTDINIINSCRQRDEFFKAIEENDLDKMKILLQNSANIFTKVKDAEGRFILDTIGVSEEMQELLAPYLPARKRTKSAKKIN